MKTTFTTIILICICLTNINSTNLPLHDLHDFFIGVMKIDHNPKTKGLEITNEYFTDDLEHAIETAYGEKLFLGTSKESKKADELINKYFKENVSILVDGKAVSFSYLGKEYENQNQKTFFYTEVLNVPSFKKINIQNEMIFNIERSQTNIIHVKNKGGKKMLRLTYKNSKQELNFK